MPTIADQPIARADIRVFEQGDWFAEVLTTSEDLLTVGTRVDIVAETILLSGAIVRGNVTPGAEGFVGRYQVAGRPEWDKPLKPRAYNSAGSVLLKTVVSDLARETLGNAWPSLVVMPPAANLDRHYERSGTFGDVELAARDALERLGLPWYVRADGVTVFAARPSGDVSTTETIRIEYRNDAIGYRVVNCEDPGALVPGLSFDGEVIGEVVYSITSDDIRVHTWARSASNAWLDALRTGWRRLFPRGELQGLCTYITVGPSQNGKHDLRSLKSRHLPDVKLAETWGGAGIAHMLSAGTRVLLAFADGDPSTPVLVAVDPSALPDATIINASTSLGINADLVNLGGATSYVVVDSGNLQAYFTSLQGVTGVPPPVGYTSTKVKA